MLTKNDLEKKIWFRFLKVMYLGIYVIGFTFILTLSYSIFPHQVSDESNARVVCNNNKKIDFSISDQKRATIICEYDLDLLISNGTVEKGNIEYLRNNGVSDEVILYRLYENGTLVLPEQNNHSIVIPYKHVGSYQEAIKIFCFGIIILVLVVEIIKGVFIYVVTGRVLLSNKQ